MEAYKLESQKAIDPLIIASEKLIEHSKEFVESNNQDLDCMLVNDEEGVSFLNQFNYSLIDSKLSDQMVADLIKSTGIVGVFDETFEEKDLKDKQETLSRTKELSELELENSESESIKAKHNWLMDFFLV